MKAIITLVSRKAMLLFALFLLVGVISQAQMKIGSNPSVLQRSSILELESTRQGLLLPRLDDTLGIDALTPPDGMIIFLNSDKTLRLRSNGVWKKIADFSQASANWSMTGNAGTDPSVNFIGTLDGKPLVMRTNNAERIRIDADGNIGIGTTNPSAKLNVDGTVKFENLGTGTNELEVLVLQADGSVLKRAMSASAFENAVKAINGIQWENVKITAAASDTATTVHAETRTSDSTIAIYLPVQDGSSATKPYGLLSYDDWQKINSGLQELTIGAVASASDAKGATIETTTTSRTIILHPADATNPGIVTAEAQTFGGDKTFAGNVTVDGNTSIGGNAAVTGNATVSGNATINGTVTLNSVTDNASADSVLVLSGGEVQKRKVSSAAFGNAVRSINGNNEEDEFFAFTSNGSDLTISTNGTDSIYLNVPSAGTSARGVVTVASQDFAGNKSFQDGVLVGSTGTANSTMQIAGSVAMNIRLVEGTDNVTATDNTILASTASAAFTLTLPAASASIKGRIYTIKKVGGDIDNPLTISPGSGGAKIEGGTSYVMYNDWTYISIQTDGTNWYIIKK